MPFDSLGNIGPQQHLSNERGSGRSSLFRNHVVSAAFIPASLHLRQVCFGRPTFRFDCGFQSRACLLGDTRSSLAECVADSSLFPFLDAHLDMVLSHTWSFARRKSGNYSKDKFDDRDDGFQVNDYVASIAEIFHVALYLTTNQNIIQIKLLDDEEDSEEITFSFLCDVSLYFCNRGVKI